MAGPLRMQPVRFPVRLWILQSFLLRVISFGMTSTYKVNDAWRDDFHTYEWSAPENITLLVSFNVKNGEEISCSWSSGNWTGPAYDVKAVSLGSRPTGTGKMI